MPSLHMKYNHTPWYSSSKCLHQQQRVKITGSDNKSKQQKAQQNVFVQLVLLALMHNFSLGKVLSYPLGPVPCSLATADGSSVKTDKSKLVHALEGQSKLTEQPSQGHMYCIIDGNALLQAQMALSNTFEELAEKVLDQLPKVQRTDVGPKTCHLSINEAERLHSEAFQQNNFVRLQESVHLSDKLRWQCHSRSRRRGTSHKRKQTPNDQTLSSYFLTFTT